MALANMPKIVRKASGVAEYDVVAEASGQSFVAGELVYLAAGLATAVASTGQVIYGIAQEAASASATTAPNITVEVIRPGDEVEITCSTTVAYTNVGIGYPLVIVAGTSCKLNLAAHTTEAAVIVRPVLNDDGQFTTRAIVHFSHAVCQSTTGA
jgi:hypothetical protein